MSTKLSIATMNNGGAWKLAAMESIAKWLQENVPMGVRIIA